MINKSALTVKTFLKLADCDRKLLILNRFISCLLTASMIFKLMICVIGVFKLIKR